MLTEYEKEMLVLIVTLFIEKGVKECIDHISTPPQSSMADCLEAHRRLHSYLHHARKLFLIGISKQNSENHDLQLNR